MNQICELCKFNSFAILSSLMSMNFCFIDLKLLFEKKNPILRMLKKGQKFPFVPSKLYFRRFAEGMIVLNKMVVKF